MRNRGAMAFIVKADMIQPRKPLYSHAKHTKAELFIAICAASQRRRNGGFLCKKIAISDTLKEIEVLENPYYNMFIAAI